MATNAGWAPHLDLQSIEPSDLKLVQDIREQSWLNNNLDALALNYASNKLVPEHYQEVRGRRERQADKALGAVHERLTKEINYLYGRAIKLDEDVKAGKQPRTQPENFRRKAEELTARLEQRTKELTEMRNVISSTPVVVGGALVIPKGLLDARTGATSFAISPEARARIERAAMKAVFDAEVALGHAVHDVSAEKCGWDITARPPRNTDGSILSDRHIEVKGRAKGQSTITITRNEIIYGLNQSDKFLLAIVVVDGDIVDGPYYVRNPFTTEPDFGVASVNYDLADLLSRAEAICQHIVELKIFCMNCIELHAQALGAGHSRFDHFDALCDDFAPIYSNDELSARRYRVDHPVRFAASAEAIIEQYFHKSSVFNMFTHTLYAFTN